MVYQISVSLVLECYRITDLFPLNERYGITQQIRRAALSVVLNIAEGASRTSPLERRRFYEIARGSLTEIDAAFDIATRLQYCTQESIGEVDSLKESAFKILCKMMSTLRQKIKKEG